VKITLTTRTSQQLSLTPQLQQAIRLLTLSNLELRQELDDFIRDNPLLELEDNPEAGAVDGPSEATEEPAEQTAAGEEELDSLADWKTSDHSGDDDEREDRDACPVQLADHLRDQVAGLHLQPRDRLWLEILIQALDPDGFLRDEPHELAASFDNLFIAQFEEPLDADEVARCRPVYERFEGWSESTAGITDWDRLPAAARRYLQRVEQLVGVPIDMVSTGPDRDHTIVLRHPFNRS
jgi:DNA-directed RNA polymerase specialized sigma54-like protein